MSKSVSYARAALKLNGVKVVYIQDVNISHDNGLLPIEQLDSNVVAEHAELGHKVSFTCGVIKIDENAAELFGFDPQNVEDLKNQPELVAELYDSVSDKVRYTISGVKFEGGTLNVAIGGVLTGQWRFVGRRGKGI